MNLTFMVARNEMLHYLGAGKSLKGFSEGSIDKKTRGMHYSKFINDLSTVLQENNTLNVEYNLYIDNREEDSMMMRKLFAEKIILRTKYESILYCIGLLNGKFTVEEFENNMNKLADESLEKFIKESEDRMSEEEE